MYADEAVAIRCYLCTSLTSSGCSDDNFIKSSITVSQNCNQCQVMTTINLCLFEQLLNKEKKKTSSVKGQSEKMSLEPCSKLTATDGRGAKVKRAVSSRQLELR